MPVNAQPATLVCTLGGKAQIVTFALDYLLNSGIEIDQVYVLHLSPGNGRIAQALQTLYRSFAQNHYQGRPCRFQAIALKQGLDTIPRIHNASETNAAQQAIFEHVQAIKMMRQAPVHLCIAGGPRLLALLTLSAATIYCEHGDKVWHMYTDPDFRAEAGEGAILHDETGEHVTLLEVPMLAWGFMRHIFQNSPQLGHLQAAQQNYFNRDEHQRCEQVWKNLTDREREVLIHFAQGKSVKQVGQSLSITRSTVDSHKKEIFAQCRTAWQYPEDHYLDYHWLAKQFGAFVKNQGGYPGGD